MYESGVSACFVAAPLMARSGVYNSVHDTIGEARSIGLDWSAIVGVRASAGGAARTTDGVREIPVITHGPRVVAEILGLLKTAPEFASAAAVVTLISQSDMALALSRLAGQRPWVCYVRGLPWPDLGEQTRMRSVLLRRAETIALRRSTEVWATTPILAAAVSPARTPLVVPAGIALLPRVNMGSATDGVVVWAGRLDVDKRPELFLRIADQLDRRAVVYGEGPLTSSVQRADGQVEYRGWASPDTLWKDASVFVGTSSREAFGRSAVEAASAGVPVVIGSAYGAAELLYTEPELRKLLVIDSDDPGVWSSAVNVLCADKDLYKRASDHVHANATSLSVRASVDSIQRRLKFLVAQ